MKIRYFALLRRQGNERRAVGVFREVRRPGSRRLEHFSRQRRWVLDNGLARYTAGGDTGAVEISEARALKLVQELPASGKVIALRPQVTHRDGRAGAASGGNGSRPRKPAAKAATKRTAGNAAARKTAPRKNTARKAAATTKPRRRPRK